jgi:hypothetical protein
MSKVTHQEIIDALNMEAPHFKILDSEYPVSQQRKDLAERIQTHGIQLPYVPMTDDELWDTFDNSEGHYKVDGYRGIEQAVLNRLGVVPTFMNQVHIESTQSDYQQTQPTLDQELAYAEALQIATYLWRNHYAEVAPDWEALPDLRGVLSQIDNMVAGINFNVLNQAKAICEQNGFVVVPFELVDKIDIALRAQSLS